MDISQIKKLIQLLKDNDLGEIKVQEGDAKITIRHKDFNAKNTAIVPVEAGGNSKLPSQETPALVAKDQEETISSNVATIKAPMIGTFYRAATEGKEPFVKVGDKIKKGDVLCIIEAMKLFNEIQSEVTGKIVKVMVDNAQAVEYDQPLFLIEPN